MKSKNPFRILFLIISIISLIAIQAYSQEEESKPSVAPARPAVEQPAPMPPLPPPQATTPADTREHRNLLDRPDKGCDVPDLTQEQKEKMRKIDLDHMANITPLKNQLLEQRAHLNVLLTGKQVNMTEVNKTAEAMGTTIAQILKTDIVKDQAIRAILTDEQRIIFDSHPKPFLHPFKKQKNAPGNEE